MNVVWKQKKVKPHQLENAEPKPELAAHVWNYFLDLHDERPSNGFGVSRITSSMIKDWSDVYCIQLELWEVKAIRKIDAVWTSIQMEKQKNG